MHTYIHTYIYIYDKKEPEEGGQLECAPSPPVGGEGGRRDIVPERARVAQDIPHHVRENGLL